MGRGGGGKGGAGRGRGDKEREEKGGRRGRGGYVKYLPYYYTDNIAIVVFRLWKRKYSICMSVCQGEGGWRECHTCCVRGSEGGEEGVGGVRRGRDQSPLTGSGMGGGRVPGSVPVPCNAAVTGRQIRTSLNKASRLVS